MQVNRLERKGRYIKCLPTYNVAVTLIYGWIEASIATLQNGRLRLVIQLDYIY